MNRERFSASLPFEIVRDTQAFVVGLGNIGSHAAIALAQMGIPSMTLVDPDKVEDPNIAVQAYTNAHLGWPKAEALSMILSEYNPSIGVGAKVDKWRGTMLGWAKLYVIATDNIESRAEFYEAIRRQYSGDPYIPATVSAGISENVRKTGMGGWSDMWTRGASVINCSLFSGSNQEANSKVP